MSRLDLTKLTKQDRTRWKNSNNTYLIKSLFVEYDPDRDTAVYTLREKEHEGFPSLYQQYIEISDPTEYKFAVKCFDGWAHWEEVSTAAFFKQYIEAWRRELETKIKSRAYERIAEQAEMDNEKTLLASNRYLLEGGWLTKQEKKAGRPTKESVQKEIKKQVDLERRVDEDQERIGS